MWPLLSKWDYSVHIVKLGFLVYHQRIQSLIYIMNEIMYSAIESGGKFLKSGKYEREKSAAFKVCWLYTGTISNLARNYQNYLGFEFWSKTFTPHLQR